MPKFYVGLDGQTRYNYSPIGDRINGYFTYNAEVGRRIWREEITSDISRLAELVNEATQCVRKMNFVDLPMKVFRIEDAPVEAVEPVESKRTKLKARHTVDEMQDLTVSTWPGKEN